MLQSSGRISFCNIRDAFSGSNPVKLSDYYNDSTVKYGMGAGLPNFGLMLKFSDFYGKFKPRVTYLLDSLDGRSGCVGAFSLLRVSGEYSGPAFQIRRSRDNTVMNFFADARGNLGTGFNATGTPLRNWLGGSTGFVTKWYDQSGRSNHASNVDTTRQPILGMTTTTNFLDFKPNLFFNLPNGTVPVGNSNYTIVSMHGSINNTIGGIIGAGTYNTNTANALRRSTGGYINYWWGNDLAFNSYAPSNIVTVQYNGATRFAYVNGGFVGSLANANKNTASFSNTIGTVNGTEFLNGELFNLFIFDNMLSRKDRQAVEGIIYPPESNLVLHLDAATIIPGINIWRDLSGNGLDFIINPASRQTSNGMAFLDITGGQGAYRTSDVPYFANATIICFTAIFNSTGDWRTLTRSLVNDHAVLIQSGTNTIGQYDNTIGTFNTASYDITNIPDVTTQFNMLTFKLSSSSPYWQMYVNNNTTPVASITNFSARYKYTFGCIGGTPNAIPPNAPTVGQRWGRIGAFLYYGRHITDAEMLNIYDLYKDRYGLNTRTYRLRNSGATLTDFTIKITLPYTSLYRTDFQDVRFIDQETNTTLPFWIESVNSNVSASMWLRVPTLADGRLLVIKPGNDLSTGSPYDVFPVYDDFTNFDESAKWAAAGSGTVTLNSNEFSFNQFGPTIRYTRTNFPTTDLSVEARIRSSSANGIPEIFCRANIVNNYGIKGRVDCRTTEAGIGTFVDRPFGLASTGAAADWSVLRNGNFSSFPSNNTYQNVRLQALGNVFRFYYNDALVLTPYTNALVNYNTGGCIGFMNHFGVPVTYTWIRAYKETTQNIYGQFVSLINRNPGFANVDITANMVTTGLTQISALASIDDGSAALTIPFDFFFFGTNYGNNNNGGIFLNTNNAIVFGGANSAATFLATTARAILFGAANRRINTAHISGVISSSNAYNYVRVLVFAQNSFNDGVANALQYEIRFIVGNNIQAIQINVATTPATQGTWDVSDGTSFYGIFGQYFSVAANKTVLLISDTTGREWSVYYGSSIAL
jgi:hypothetical protein